MIKRCVIGGILCAAVAACGANVNTPANPLAPSTVAPLAPSVGEGGRVGVQSIGSCPDGNAPGWLTPWVKDTTVRLRWSEVAPVIDYHVVVERYDVTNKYLLAEDFMTINNTWAQLTLPPGRYRGMIQTKSCGKNMGPWSEPLQFSVDGSAERGVIDADAGPGAIVPPTEVPPTEVPPQGNPVESAEGTKVFPNSAMSLIDSSNVAWTFGVEDLPGIHQVERNGVPTYAWGSILKYHDHHVYVRALDNHWYVSDGSASEWSDTGLAEP